MPLRLVPWSPEYGSGIEADAGAVDDDGASLVDDAVEGPWRVMRPADAPPPAVQIVDGVRRVEAHAIDDLGDGTIAFGLFGSYAVGVVRCEGTRAHILEGDRVLRVRAATCKPAATTRAARCPAVSCGLAGSNWTFAPSCPPERRRPATSSPRSTG